MTHAFTPDPRAGDRDCTCQEDMYAPIHRDARGAIIRAGIEQGSRHEYVMPETWVGRTEDEDPASRPIIARMAWLSRLTRDIETSLGPVRVTDTRSARERYIDGVAEAIDHEARVTRPPYMSARDAVRTLIDERFERGILSRDERDELIERMATL